MKIGMARIYSHQDNELVEKAVVFLVNEYSKTGFNKKPVIFHSLRVACKLAEIGESSSVVAAAALHDLLEDSSVTFKLLQQEFGKGVADLVVAVSFKAKIEDKTRQYQEMLARTKAGGRNALIIKCADLLDNSDYYQLEKNRQARKILLKKLKYFIKLAELQLKNDILFKKLKKRHRELIGKLVQK